MTKKVIRVYLRRQGLSGRFVQAVKVPYVPRIGEHIATGNGDPSLQHEERRGTVIEVMHDYSRGSNDTRVKVTYTPEQNN